jgi:hypothetical protein
MRITRVAVAATALLMAACASDETTSPPTRSIESRLAAVAVSPTASVSDQSVTMMVSVTSSLPESVSGGVCAQVIEARQPSATSWTDVTSTSAACSTLAAVLAPGSTLRISAIGDQAKLRAVGGASGASVVLRARHTLAGASTSYTLQSNELTWQLP